MSSLRQRIEEIERIEHEHGVGLTIRGELYPALVAALKEMEEALKLLHDNLAEYQTLNNLGGYDNHDMRQARTALRRMDEEVR